MKVEILNYGGIITKILAPDQHKTCADVVLGFDSPEDYLKEHPYFGSLVGRFANRIAHGKLPVAGQDYKLAINNGPHSLHGGKIGFDKHFWEVTPKNSSLILTRTSEDGEEGYPGKLDVKVIYELSPQNELILKYEAKSDRPTHLNLTNHSYFNLKGAGSILDHELFINANKYTEVDETLIPTGVFKAVEGSSMDFTRLRRIGIGGYDHNFVLNGEGNALKHAATLLERASGRVMEVHTTQPGLQFYSGNFLNGTLVGKQGHFYGQHAGLCLETQHFPDSPHWPQFPSTLLRPGEIFESTTVYKFYTL